MSVIERSRYEYHCAEPGCPHKGQPRTAPCIKDRHACLTVEFVPADQLQGAVSAITAHRDRWVKANGTNPDNARPADLELWALVGGIEGGQ